MRARLILATAFGLLALSPAALAQEKHEKDCAEYSALMRQAFRDAKPDLAADILSRAEHAHVCSGGQLATLGEQAALTGYKDAFDAGKSTDERIYALEKALKLGRPWQALAALGDEMQKRGKFARAAALYSEAADKPSGPPANLAALLRRKAAFAALLAPDYRPVIMRCGQTGRTPPAPGARKTARKTVLARRGCEDVSAQPAPVPFASGSARLTPRGKAFAAAMLAWARRTKAGRVILTGYSDRRGNALVNFRLSMKRARAVRRYFRQHGFTGGVSVRARGETAPPVFLSGLPEMIAARACRRVDIRADAAGEDAK